MPDSYEQKRRAVQEAILAAERTLDQLGVDQSQPIEIFRIIQEENVWLMFQPMKNIFGFYLKQGDTAGIQINSQHPSKLQRYTAAHEYGHHILGHLNSVDDEEVIARGFSSKDLKEVAADAFAAHFLMPPRLVDALLKKRGASDSLSANEVYRLSLEMEVSYVATLNRLANLGHLSNEESESFRKLSPKSIKAGIGMKPLQNPRAEIWSLDRNDHEKKLKLRVHDDLKIRLPENPSTGYLWEYDGRSAHSPNPKFPKSTDPKFEKKIEVKSNNGRSDPRAAPPLLLVDERFESSASSENEPVCGSGGFRFYTFRVLKTGSYALNLLEKRPWEDDSEAEDRFSLQVNVASAPTGLNSRGLFGAQKEILNSTARQSWDAA